MRTFMNYLVLPEMLKKNVLNRLVNFMVIFMDIQEWVLYACPRTPRRMHGHPGKRARTMHARTHARRHTHYTLKSDSEGHIESEN